MQMRPTGNQMLISLIMRVCDRQQTRDWNKFLHFTYSIEVLKKKVQFQEISSATY